MPTITFTALLENRGGNTAAFDVPPAVVEQLGSGRRPKVVVTLGAHSWRSSIAVYGGAYFLGVSMANRKAANAVDGEIYEVGLTLDEEERTITPPDDLVAALTEAGLIETWGRLSYSHQREHVQHIDGAKAAATRARRIAKTITDLAAKPR